MFFTCVMTILSIVLLEALLSVDNAVVISTIANKAKPEDRNKVIKYGIVGAFLFRGLALCGVGWLMNNPEVGGIAKILGGIYLVRMGYGIITPKQDSVEEGEIPYWVERLFSIIGLTGLWLTIFEVELVDMVFSIDNLFAAVAFTENLKGEIFGLPLNITLTVIGVILGIITMRFVTVYVMKLTEKYSSLEHSAGFVILILGVKLMLSAIFTLLEPNSLEFFSHQIERFAYFMETVKPYVENHITDFLFSLAMIGIFAYPIIKSKLSK